MQLVPITAEDEDLAPLGQAEIARAGPEEAGGEAVQADPDGSPGRTSQEDLFARRVQGLEIQDTEEALGGGTGSRS